MWGQHKITYSPDRTILAKKCVGSACMSCRDTAWLAQLPSNPKWEEVEAQLRGDEKARTMFSEWTSRRFGEKVPRYARQSVQETIKIGMRWEDSYVPLTAEQFSQQFPGVSWRQVPGLKVETVRDSRGTPREVLLTRDISTMGSRVVVYYQTESELHEHQLLPETHLRPQQGQEFWTKMLEKAMQTRPAPIASIPTLDELKDMVRRSGGGPRPVFQGGVASTTSGTPASQAPVVANDALFEEVIDGDGDDASKVTGNFGGFGNQLTAPESAAALALQDGSGAETMADGGQRAGRRLRAQVSDPAAPERKKPKARVSTGSKGARGKSPGAPDNGLTVRNLLRGLVDKPKVGIYHRRLQLPGLQKTLSVADYLTEEAQVAALAAAERLQPGELPRLPEEELRPALDLILKQMPANELPKETLSGLVRRRALLALESPAMLMKVAWPWHTDSSSLRPREFDPYEPTMSTIPDNDDFNKDDKMKLAADIIVKDALATYMLRRELGINLVVGLAAVACNVSATTSALAAEVIANVQAIAAIVQKTPATSEQLKALVTLRDRDHAPGSFTDGLTQLLAEPWWTTKLNMVWETAAAESLAAPTIEKIERQLASGNPADAEQAWDTVHKQKKYHMAKKPAIWCHNSCDSIIGDSLPQAGGLNLGDDHGSKTRPTVVHNR